MVIYKKRPPDGVSIEIRKRMLRGGGFVIETTSPGSRTLADEAELVGDDLDGVLGVALIDVFQLPFAVGSLADRRDVSRDIEAVAVFDRGLQLVAADLVFETADDAGGHAEGHTAASVRVFVVRDEDHVALDVGGCLRRVDGNDLVVAGRRFGAGAVIALVDDVQLGGSHPRLTLAVLAEVGPHAVRIGPGDDVGRRVADGVAQDPQVEVDLVAGSCRGIPAETTDELVVPVAGQCLGIALFDEQRSHFDSLVLCSRLERGYKFLRKADAHSMTKTITYLGTYCNNIVKIV
jgi:hypothetical protein